MSKKRVNKQEAKQEFSFWLKGAARADYQIAAFVVEEALSKPTRIDILLKSASGFNFTKYLGQKASLAIKSAGLANITYFSGLIAYKTDFFTQDEVLTRLTILPRLSKLATEAHYRVFQNQSTVEIIDQILLEHDIDDSLWSLQDQLPKHDFLMQYGETDFAFITRLMAEAGLFYYFVHGAKGQQRLVICDDLRSLVDCPNGGVVKIGSQKTAVTSKLTQNDVYCYDLKRSQPAAGLCFSNAAGMRNETVAQQASRQFPMHKTAFMERQSICVSGAVDTALPSSGHRLTLQASPDKSLNASWYLTSAHHEGVGVSGYQLGHNLPQYFAQDFPLSQLAEHVHKMAANHDDAVHLNDSYQDELGGSCGKVPEQEDDLSVYGVRNNKAKIIPLKIKGRAQGQQEKQNKNDVEAVYHCIFHALDKRSDFQPEQITRPTMTGPVEAQLVDVDIAAQAYQLRMQFRGQEQAATAKFWVAAKSEFGAAVESSLLQKSAQVPPKILLDFIEGNPNHPVVRDANHKGIEQAELRTNNGDRADKTVLSTMDPHDQDARQEQLKKAAEQPENTKSPSQDAVYSGGKNDTSESQTAMMAATRARIEKNLNAAQIKLDNKALGASKDSASETVAGHYPYIAHYVAKNMPLEQTDYDDNDYIHVSSQAYGERLKRLGQTDAASPWNDSRLNEESVIPLAKIQADLKNSTAPKKTWSSIEKPKLMASQPVFEEETVPSMPRHQREDIAGIFELNCGEKYLCRSKTLHLNVADKLILRGPGGKIIIDKYSMTFESPDIRFKGRMTFDENVFEQQAGMRAAIRDELPLVADCHGKAAPSSNRAN